MDELDHALRIVRDVCHKAANQAKKDTGYVSFTFGDAKIIRSLLQKERDKKTGSVSGPPNTPLDEEPPVRIEDVITQLRFFAREPELLQQAPAPRVAEFLEAQGRCLEEHVDDGEIAEGTEFIDSEDGDAFSPQDVAGEIRNRFDHCLQRPGRALRTLAQVSDEFISWVKKYDDEPNEHGRKILQNLEKEGSAQAKLQGRELQWPTTAEYLSPSPPEVEEQIIERHREARLGKRPERSSPPSTEIRSGTDTPPARRFREDLSAKPEPGRIKGQRIPGGIELALDTSQPISEETFDQLARTLGGEQPGSVIQIGSTTIAGAGLTEEDLAAIAGSISPSS